MTDLPARPPSLPQRREQAIEALTQLFTSEQIDIDEFETRLDRLYQARSVEGIQEVEADLPPLPVPSDRHQAGRLGATEGGQLILAVLGGTERKGAWTPGRKMNAFAMMGGMGLDFREAVFAAGVTELNVVAMMGEVEILVPPGLRVECEGFGLLGDFEGLSQGDRATHPEEATLRIKGVAIMGAVEVSQRRPRESAKEKKRRLKRGEREGPDR